MSLTPGGFWFLSEQFSVPAWLWVRHHQKKERKSCSAAQELFFFFQYCACGKNLIPKLLQFIWSAGHQKRLRLDNEQLIPATFVRFVFQSVMLIILPKKNQINKRSWLFYCSEVSSLKSKSWLAVSMSSIFTVSSAWQNKPENKCWKGHLGESFKDYIILQSMPCNLHIYLNSVCMHVCAHAYPMKHLEFSILLVKHLFFHIYIIPH